MLQCLETFAGELAIRFVSDHDIDGLCALARKMEATVQAGDHYAALTIDVAHHTSIYRWSRHTLLLEMWETLFPRVEFLQAYSRLLASPCRRNTSRSATWSWRSPSGPAIAPSWPKP